MKIYNIYNHPIRGMEAIKVGFSIPAFIFGIFWMLANKLWRISVIWIGITMIAGYISGLIEKTPAHSDEDFLRTIGQIVLFIISCLMFVVPASGGNKWRENDLVRSGYKLVTTVNAETSDGAIASAANGISEMAKTGFITN